MIWSNVTTTNGTTSSTTESTTISSKSTKEKDAKESSTLDVNDFLSLLVTEMQYQDPLEPTDNSQYIAQMATFSQVDQRNVRYGNTPDSFKSCRKDRYYDNGFE